MGNVNACVGLDRQGEVAVITIANPPVNALKQEVRAGIAEGLRQAAADPAVKAVVLAADGRTFVAGADITEFNRPPQPPTLRDVIVQIEAMAVPVVAALHGTPLGGGLELALGCHFRVAHSGTRLGLPEIKLGIIPGGGGTQRLPRLIGPEKALKAIVSGEQIPASVALADGILDAVVDGDPTAAAVAFARQVLAEGRKLRLVRAREEKLEATRAEPEAFERLAESLHKRQRGIEAPAAAIESVRNAFTLPFDEGLKAERALFDVLVKGQQSQAQRHIFFAEREAAKVSDLSKDLKGARVARAAVIGAGTMGGGIAMCFANVGIPVTLVEVGEDALKAGLDRIAANYRSTVKRGGLSQAEMDRRLGQIQGTTDLAAVGAADLVIEAVFEEMEIKRRLFADLDRLAKPGALLATNTSYLDVDEIAQATARPQDVVGLHFFSPANVMRLVEVVRGKATAGPALASALALTRQLKKIPVVVGVCYGFVGNRMLARRFIEGERLLLEGALPQQVDAAMLDFGFPMGPFAAGDLAGLDIGWRNRKARGMKTEIADALCEMGRFGQKTRQGYYRYEPGSREPLADPAVEEVIVAASRRLGIERHPISEAEIVERLLYPMINEGARILDEGIAQRPSDIDVIWVYGYGWPAWRGGPMFRADHVGLARIAERLGAFAARTGDPGLEPAPLLVRLAQAGQGFASLGAR